MDCSTPGFTVLHYMPEFAQTHPFSQWWCLTISFSAAPFSSCPQSFPALGSFPMSQIFTSGGFWGSVIYSRPDIFFTSKYQDWGGGGSQVVLTIGKKSTCNAGDTRDSGRETWIGKIPWRRRRQHTPVFLKSLVGYSAWGHKESDTTEAI